LEAAAELGHQRQLGGLKLMTGRVHQLPYLCIGAGQSAASQPASQPAEAAAAAAAGGNKRALARQPTNHLGAATRSAAAASRHWLAHSAELRAAPT